MAFLHGVVFALFPWRRQRARIMGRADMGDEEFVTSIGLAGDSDLKLVREVRCVLAARCHVPSEKLYPGDRLELDLGWLLPTAWDRFDLVAAIEDVTGIVLADADLDWPRNTALGEWLQKASSAVATAQARFD